MRDNERLLEAHRSCDILPRPLHHDGFPQIPRTIIRNLTAETYANHPYFIEIFTIIPTVIVASFLCAARYRVNIMIYTYVYDVSVSDLYETPLKVRDMIPKSGA
ncbi:hypothetical protein PX554_00370 [Sphingomonas sp. H39-1-10]|uniref:hypothetical protein n=1 Tax=Sphingomonas pollutisoli TaxID=3030829 RepID=UPI0023B9A5E7|nr:hypothetical protein [Sphingomonas pollutisoli]MDF0486568.1 hypothetical protein [Sphingomonas pollutisoli]